MRWRLAINDQVHSPGVKPARLTRLSINIEGRIMRRIGFSLLSLTTPLLIIVCHPVFGQTSPNDQIVKTRTDLVNVGILAKQKKTGRMVTNLTKNDFTIFEDGVQQTVSYFNQERLPLSIILLVDRAGCINAFNNQIRAATVKAFGDLKPEDEVAIMTFSNKVALAQPFTRDSQLITEKVMAVERQH